MRLICPNCGAQYAVDDRVIPDAGRDVQCSNCGNTWFQNHPDFDGGLAEELGVEAPGVTAAADEPQLPPTAAPSAIPEPAPVSQPAAVPDDGLWDVAEDASEPAPVATAPDAAKPSDDPEPVSRTSSEPTETSDIPASPPEPAAVTETEEDPAIAPAPQRPRRKLDEDVLAVLREEAAREEAARSGKPAPAAGAPHVETTVVAPLPQPTAEPDAPGDDFTHENRRNLLPDIEEINSTLSPAEHGDAAVAGETEAEFMARMGRRKSGRRIGFGLALVGFGIAALVYVQAPRLARSFPNLEGQLVQYTATVNQGRVWLDRLVVDTFGDGEG